MSFSNDCRNYLLTFFCRETKSCVWTLDFSLNQIPNSVGFQFELNSQLTWIPNVIAFSPQIVYLLDWHTNRSSIARKHTSPSTILRWYDKKRSYIFVEADCGHKCHTKKGRLKLTEKDMGKSDGKPIKSIEWMETTAKNLIDVIIIIGRIATDGQPNNPIKIKDSSAVELLKTNCL